MFVYVRCLLTRTTVFREDVAVLKYVSIVAVYFFVIMFATGPGSIPWFLVSEMFGVGARGLATSLAVACNWTAATLVFFGFLPLQVRASSAAFPLPLTPVAFLLRTNCTTRFSSSSQSCSSSSGPTRTSESRRRREGPSKRSPASSVKERRHPLREGATSVVAVSLSLSLQQLLASFAQVPASQCMQTPDPFCFKRCTSLFPLESEPTTKELALC